MNLLKRIIKRQAVCLPTDFNKTEKISRYSFSWLIDRICINVIKEDIPYLHSHPWNFVSIILWGKYKEIRVINNNLIEKVYGIGSILKRNHNEFHRIIPISNKVITLFFRSKPYIKSSFYLINGQPELDIKVWLSQGYDKKVVKEAYRKMDNNEH